MTSLKEEIIKKKKIENNYINYENNENIILCKICHKIDCPLTIKNKNSIKNVEKKDIVFYEKEEKQIMNHFASLSTNKGNINVGDCINNAVYLSHKMKKINKNEKIKNPNKFHDFKEIIKYPGLISSKYDEDVQLFILSLIADVLSQKGIKVTIYKKNEGMNNLNSASLQYLFNGLKEKKKYENDILLKKGDELNDFIEEWKSKITKQLKIDKSEIFLINPKDKNGLSLDLVTNEGNINYNKLKDFDEIKNIKEKSLIEGCQLSTDIFDSNQKKEDSNWGIGEFRGGEKYIPPLGWYGYRLKVSKTYDKENDDWLSYDGRKANLLWLI